jgi:predicted DsbA family dithiol-disulfide isomerase
MKAPLLLFILALFAISGRGQTKMQEMENQRNNPLLCDIETGICELPAVSSGTKENVIEGGNKPIKVIYYTDPICSSCWGIEPQLRKLKLQYGSYMEIDYRMGGLLPDWSYNSGGIGKPSDVAHHWDEASAYYDMPIDGDVWLEDPLSSSYPPSIAFKAAQMQDKEKAITFMREMREMLFMQKKNITKWEIISAAAENAGLDVQQLQSDYNGKAKEVFEEDLELAKRLGVRGFPTLFFADSLGNVEKVYGSKPLSVYEGAIAKLQPTAKKYEYEADWQSLFSKYPTLTAREFAELSEIPRSEADDYLQKLYEAGHLDKLASKNGTLWQQKGAKR